MMIPTRLRSFLFLTIFLGLLAPFGIMAQSDIDLYIWPDQTLNVVSIGADVPVGGAFDGVSTLHDLAGFGVLGALGKNAGDLGDLLDVAEAFYGMADQGVQQVQQLDAVLKASSFAGWQVNGFTITTNIASSDEVGASPVSIWVLNYVDDDRTTNFVAASIPDLVTIPNPYTGNPSRSLPVEKIVNIGPSARIYSLSIGQNVNSIATHALDIAALTNITAGSSYFSSADGVLFNGDKTVLVRYPEGLGGNYVVPSSVTNIADNAFGNCSNLTSLVIGTNVVQIGHNAFANSGLQVVYFARNAPFNDGTAFSGDACTVYYLTGTSGWGASYGGIPATLYNPFSYTPANGAITINGFSGNGWHNPACSTVLIPNVINGLPVTSIADSAFYYNAEGTGLTNLVIPDSVTNIGNQAFTKCLDLVHVTLSTNLTSLGEEAFLGCPNLVSLIVPNGVQTIPAGVVEYCTGLRGFIMGTNVTSIGQAAFAECSSLFYLSLPASLTTIGPSAFGYCGSLRISVDPSNPRWSSDSNGALYNKAQTELVHANTQNSGSYTVPDTVVSIDEGSFYGANLSAVFVPAGVTYVGISAFANCSNLSGAYFAGNPPKTEGLAFSGSDNAIVYVLPNAVGWPTNYAGATVKLWTPYQMVTNNNSLTLTAYSGPGGNVVLPGNLNGTPVTAIQAGIFSNPGAITSLTLPDSVTNIPDNAFTGLINLKTIVFGNNVTSIGNNAFYGCTNLANLTIPNSVKTIGTAAFSHCGITNLVIGSGLSDLSDHLFDSCQLQSLTIPATVIHIEASTFANNPLQYVVIPNSVTTLGADAFANCEYLTHAYFQGNAPANDGTAFSGDYVDGYAHGAGTAGVIYSTRVEYLPNTTGWKSDFGGAPAEVLQLYYSTHAGSITVTQFVGSGVFPIFSTINGLPVTGIGDYAFANCPGLTGVIIPAGITSIGAGPFMNCPHLTNLVVAAGNQYYQSVSNVLFNLQGTVLKQYPAGLSGAYQIPATVTNIGAGAFYGSAIKQMVIPAGVTGIGSEAFSFCRTLTSLTVAPGNVSYTNSGGVLFNAAQTMLVQFPGGLGGNYTVPAGVTSLGGAAFASSGVTSVVIPTTVSTIPSDSLAYCGALTNITIQAGNANFASVNGMLENAAQTTLLQYPGGLTGSYILDSTITSIGNQAFAGGSLSSVTLPATVSSLGANAFADCESLLMANFFGNAPSNDGSAFANDTNALVNWLPSTSGWGTEYGGARTQEIPFAFSDNGNHTVTVTGYIGTSDFVAIPQVLFGETVSAIGDNAFANQTNITTLSIPSTVTNIGQYAFKRCVYLSSLQLRNSGNLNVGYGAFQECASLTSVGFLSTAPATIGDYAFYGCTKLNNIVFGAVTNIGNYSFYGCTALKYVSIGDSVVSIGDYAFANDGSTQIVLPASLKTLGSNAFANCGSATGYASVYTYGNPPTSDGTAFASGYATIFYSPGTGWGATYDGMGTMAYPSFFNFTVNTSGATITSLVFGNSDLIIPAFVFSSSGVQVPVVAIGSNAFAGNLTITNVTFPSSLTSIQSGAFLNCSNLVSASLPDSLTSIGNSAFQNCVKLQGINISQTVTNIGDYAFAGCPGETNLTFGADLAYLGTNAFAGWTNLQTVYFNGNAPAGNAPAFAGDTNAVVYVLPGSLGWGANYFGFPVAQWTQYLYRTNTDGSIAIQFYLGNQSVVAVPSEINGRTVTSLENLAFYDRRDIKSVILPDTITSIGSQAFKYCSLTNIVLSTNLVSISSEAFYGCALQSVVLPDSLTNLENNAFFLSGLTNVVFSKQLISIGAYAFAHCPLSSVPLPQSLQTIGNYAFNQAGLTNITLPPKLTSIGDRAFWGCPMAGTILIPPDVTYIGDEAFYSSVNGLSTVYFEGNTPGTDGTPFDGLASYSVINGVKYATGPGIAYFDPTTYGWGKDYYGLQTATWHPYSYTINGSTITITGYSGSGGALKLPATIGGYSVTAIADNAFASNSSLTQLTMPSSITYIGTGAFAGSTNLTAVYFNGNAPVTSSNLFAGDNLQLYYLDSTTGWSASLSGVNISPYAATGVMTITITPSSIGAQWQVDGGAYYASGATATNLSVGSHVVSFSTVGGHWQTPNNITLYVGAFQGSQFTMPYEYIPFDYVTNGDGSLTITGYSANGGTVYIPTKINGATVSGIAANAFANSSITGIILPETIAYVGTNAFAGCQNLVTASVGSGITNLSGNVFMNCPNLLSVFFDGNAPATDGTIFSGDSIVSVYYLTTATGWSTTYSGSSASVIPYTFSVLGDNTISITGYNGPGGNVTIPGTIGGLPVSDIYSSVFQNNLSLTSVTIPDSVKSIEYQAFAGCSNLRSVVMGTNVQWIGAIAFINCTSLTNINFPDSLQEINQQAFQRNEKLASIHFGPGLKSIDDAAFESCTNLSNVTFGNSLTNIGPSAFAYCGALSNLVCPDGLLAIQSGAFSVCTNLSSATFNTNLAYIGTSAFGNCTGLTNLYFPSNIYLGTNAFAFCQQLQTVFFGGEVDFVSAAYVDPFYDDPSAILYYTAGAYLGGWISPDLATSDYKSAVAYTVRNGNGSGPTVSIEHFAGMNGADFVIPSSLAGYPVTSVASNALNSFIGNLVIGPGITSIGTITDPNFGVVSISVDQANPFYSINNGVLFDKNQTTLIRFPTSMSPFGSYTVPSSVTSIADNAFAGCRLGRVTLSPNTVSIGNDAFKDASYLTSVSNPTPDALTFLGQNAFEGCSSLTNFITGNNLASVQPWAFADCTQLRSVTLGQALGSIGVGAFSNCVNLASIAFPPSLGSIGSGAFGNCQSLATLTMPAGVPTGTNYYSIQLGSGVFAGCTGLQSAYFLGNAPYPDYGNNFAGDSQLTLYYLADSYGWSTTYDGISTASFAPFGSLKVSFTQDYAGTGWQVDGGAFLTNGATATGLSAGSHTISFATVNGFYTPPDQVVVVTNLSLTTATATYVRTPLVYTVNTNNCITITGDLNLNSDGFLVVPPSINGVRVTGIGDGAFYNHQSLVGVILPYTVTNIGVTSFLNCTNLAYVILDTNLLSIGTQAFYGCKALQSVQIPDSVTNLSQGAFSSCVNLTSAQIGSGLTAVGYNTFSGDSRLATLFFDGAPPSDVSFLTNDYPQLAKLYYDPNAGGWDSVSAGYSTNWASLFKYTTNDLGGITIAGMQPNYYYYTIIIPPRIGGLPVTTIGDNAFKYTGQSFILMPSTVDTVGSNAFYSCSMQGVFLGAAITNIGPNAFSDCGNLASLFVDPENPSYSDVNGILYNKAQTELMTSGSSWGRNAATPVQLTVPNGVLKIDDAALSGLYYVSQINLPASLTTIGEEALSGGNELTAIMVDASNASFITKNSALFNRSGTVLIQYFGDPNIPQYTIPSGVQFIGSGAFESYYGLTNVTIPSSVINIGAEAFSGCGFTSLVLPMGLTSISPYLFEGCQDLTSIVIPAGVTSIGDFAFANCGLTQIQLPAGLTYLGSSAFASSAITSIVIPDQVGNIGQDAFSSCNNLTTVALGAGVTNIGVEAFGYDHSLSSVSFDDNLVSISTNAFYACSALGQVIFPASLTRLDFNSFWYAGLGDILFQGNAPETNGPVFNSGSIYYYSGTTGWGATFSGRSTADYNSQFTFADNGDGTLSIVGCSSSVDIELPSQNNGALVTGIASDAFAWKAFDNVTIPAGITNIAPDAFAYCSVRNIIIEGINPACTNLNGSLYDPSLTTLIAPADLSSFNLPSTVTNLLLSTFQGCYNLASITVDAANPVYSAVGGVLFDKQKTVLLQYPLGKLAGSYSIPESTTTIGTNALAGTYLAAIRVPASVTNIQPYAMGYNHWLKGVYFEGAAPQLDSTAFTNDTDAILFCLPPASTNDFASAGVSAQEWLSLFNWVTNDSSITITGYNDPNNQNYVLFPNEGISGLPVNDIGTAFASISLTGIVLPDGMTNIDVGAFSNSGLSEAMLPTNLTWIGSNAFSGCSLYDVTIPVGVSYIGDQAFANNYLTNLFLPASVQDLGNDAFNGNQIADMSLTNGLLNIGDNAFANNYLSQIYIPSSVTNIGVGAFANNYLTNAVIDAAISEIQTQAFENNSLESVSLPAGLLTIDDSAFSGNQIESLIIPPGVTNIGPSAFADNYVSSLQLPDTLVSVGDSAFIDCSLSTLLVPASVTDIGGSAFLGNSIETAYFLGNAPTNDDGTALSENYDPIAYYFPGTTGWGSTYGGVTAQMLSEPATGLTNADNTITMTTYVGTGSVVVPATVGGLPVTIIGSDAFATSGSLIHSITLPNGITGLSYKAFADCPALTTVVIPATVTNIDIDAFAGCPGLTNIIVSPDNPMFSSVNGVLFDKGQTTLLACGGGVTGNYVIPSTVTAIGADAFMGCSGLTNVVLPAGLTCIGDPAFAYCDNLTTLTIPSTVTNLGDYSFAYCLSLTTVYFEGNAPPDDGTVFVGDVNTTVYYRPSAIGFGSTFGSVPAKALEAPIANPITVYSNIGSEVQISITNLASEWIDPNNAYPVRFQNVGNASTNMGPVVKNLDSITYSNPNNVKDQIIYTMADSQGMVGVGVINIVPIGLGLTGSGVTNVTLNWLGSQFTTDLISAFDDARYGAAALTYSVVSNSNPTLVSALINGSTLTLAPLHNQNGTAQISVRATNPDGAYVDNTMTVMVQGVLLANNISAQRTGTNSVEFSISKLLSTASVPYTNDSASLLSFSTTTSQGGSVTNDSSYITYHPPLNTNPDSIAYVIADSHGDTAVGVILISYKPDTSISVNQPTLTVTATERHLQFHGIPGQHYDIQAADAVSGPWSDLSGVLTADANGLILFDDTQTPVPPVRYYRLSAAP